MDTTKSNNQLKPEQILTLDTKISFKPIQSIEESLESLQFFYSELGSKQKDEDHSYLQKIIENLSINLKSILTNIKITNSPSISAKPSTQKEKQINPMKNFQDNPNTKMKMSKRKMQKEGRYYPKLSYYKMKIIRSFRKAVFNAMNYKKWANFRLGEEFKQRILENPQIFQQFLHDKEKINLTFIKKYFLNREIYENFKIFIENIFSISESSQCEDLCMMFKFNCCSVTVHTLECKEKWRLLREWSLFDMLLTENKFLNE